jgi:D-sedoheptulose 7-phosphate isomerase
MAALNHFRSRVAGLIEASLATKQQLLRDEVLLATIAQAAEICFLALKAGNKILLFGNGGSAADCQHIAADLVGRFAFDRAAMAAIALTVNTSSVTAIANDYGFEQVFSRQVEAFGRQGDVAIGLSTSGNSPNVLRGLSTARRMGLLNIGLTGTPGGKLNAGHDLDCCICAPSSNTPRIQECHILIGHIICELVEQEMFHAPSRVSGS